MSRTRYNRRYAYLVTMGFCLLMMGGAFLLAQGVTPVYAQDEEVPLEYYGARECTSCHRGDMSDAHELSPHALTLREPGENEEAILADFDGESVPQVQFPGEDTARPLSLEDIAYVVGVGRQVQNYLYDTGDNQLMVLPVQWNTVDGLWQPYRPDETWPGPAFDWQTNCAGCHTTGLDVETGEWIDSGVQCEACHGPGSQHIELADEAGRRASEEEILAIRAAIYAGPDAQMCGQCHTVGAASSGDLPYPTDYIPGRTDLLDTFTPSMPDDAAHWWPTGHAAHKYMQFNEWMSGGHAASLQDLRDSGAPLEDTCLACHSADYASAQRRLFLYDEGEIGDPAPEPATIENAQFGVTCVSCHAPHSLDDEGVPIDLWSEPYTLCTTCHSNTNIDFVHHPAQEMFEGREIVPNVPAVASSHFTDENGPDCVTCHMTQVPVQGAVTRSSHSQQPVLPGPAAGIEGLQDSCLGCHQEQVDAAQMQQLIDDVQADTQARIEALQAVVTDDTTEWVRTALAFVTGDGSLGIHNYAYTDALLDAIEGELGLDSPDTGSQTGS